MKITNKLMWVITALSVSTLSCKKELNVGNPNQATIAVNVTTDAGLASLAQGSIYVNGFGNSNLAWLGNSYFSLPYGYNELLADVVSAEAANQIVNIINIPDYYILDNGTKITNTATHRSVLRRNNTRAYTSAGNNPLYYMWVSMYTLNNACNVVLSQVDKVSYTGDAATKKNTFRAFCYWWKGYVYSQIGSMYYAGLIVDEPNAFNSNYKTHDEIIAESNNNFTKAAQLLGGITNLTDYNALMAKLIPSFDQAGHGGVPAPDAWIRNINTMLARNILVNRLSPFVNNNPNANVSGSSMKAVSAADWNQIIQYASNGIKATDVVFVGHAPSANGYFTPGGGSVSANTTGPNVSTTFKISERFIQNYTAGDKRFTNNFNNSVLFTSGGPFGTRYSITPGGSGMSNVYVYGTKEALKYEVYIAGSYEENALMLAEANIRTGKINEGLAFVDAVRAYQGAGVPVVSNTGLDLTQALKQIVNERRVALLFRGLSFYDSRRWGWIYDISKGGGSYGNVVLNGTTVNNNVTINYNFFDYWDVPADETELNPPASGSAAVVNPN